MKQREYKYLADAQQFYTSMGYEPIKVPWRVSATAIRMTGANPREPGGDVIGSAEQGFLQMILDGVIAPGECQSISPCFRDDVPDALHQPEFMKLELAIIGDDFSNFDMNIQDDALAFFMRYSDDICVNPENQDIELNGIELGSYGKKKIEHTTLHYGTGIAEPRFSYALESESEGYHISKFPHDEYGTIGKIREELEEVVDARKQGCKILEEIEIADLLGAIRGYAEKRDIDLADVEKFSKITSRAFSNGKRI